MRNNITSQQGYNKLMNSKQAGKAFAGIKNYGKNVLGGAKIVGSAVKSGLTKVATKVTSPLVKELKMQDEADRKNKIKGKILNEWYSGK